MQRVVVWSDFARRLPQPSIRIVEGQNNRDEDCRRYHAP